MLNGVCISPLFSRSLHKGHLTVGSSCPCSVLASHTRASTCPTVVHLTHGDRGLCSLSHVTSTGRGLGQLRRLSPASAGCLLQHAVSVSTRHRRKRVG